MKPPACRNTRKDIGDPQIKKNVATSPCEDHVICLHTFRTNVSVSWGPHTFVLFPSCNSKR